MLLGHRFPLDINALTRPPPPPPKKAPNDRYEYFFTKILGKGKIKRKALDSSCLEWIGLKLLYDLKKS